ncbi:MAG: Dabb family protein [Lachnospiraceae bacterium]|nr:Dabb family protein [Lachnospiraceae bacterium]
MKHYVLLKFKENADLDSIEKTVRDTYVSLDRELYFLHDPVVHRNTVDRDSNADIMAEIRLDSPEQLQSYLTHPLHLKMAEDLKNEVVSRISFDHE